MLKKQTLLTYSSIMVTMILFGVVGVMISLRFIQEKYIEIQLESNKRTATTVVKLLEGRIDSSVPAETILSSFQTAIEGSHSEAVYFCLYDQSDGRLLCHPDSSMIGMRMDDPKLQFKNYRDGADELLIDAVTREGEASGLLSMNQGKRSEITDMVPIPGTTWKVGIHENLDVFETQLYNLALISYIGFFLLALIVSAIATTIIRKISRKYEHLLKKRAEDLEVEVAERTSELRIAHQKLGDLEKAKSDFLSIIAHELRTPLNGIIGFSQLLEEELMNTEHQEFVNHIRTSGEKLIRFSETALLVTQLSLQQSKFDVQPISVRDLIESAVQEMEEQIHTKKISVIPPEGEQDEIIDAIPRMMKQCFLNLFDNAIRYSPEGGRIAISCEARKDGTIISIRDEGPGFSNEAYLRQFDLFGADQVMNHTEGYGLGLAAARLIMRAHSGDIEIGNQPEGGAVVKLRLARLKN